MTRLLGRFVLALVVFAAPVVARSQQPADPLARPLAAYRDLDYDAAAAGFRAAIAAEGATRLAERDRVRALMYLGATEVFRDRRADAITAFRALLFLDARYRPDDLVFPPEVSTLFNESRIGVRAVTVVVPAEARIQSTADRFPVRVYAAALHDIRAAIIDASGSPVRVLHDGAVGDSLELLWNGRDGLGRLREPGAYRLRVTSRSPAGRDEREVEVPLAITREEEDTLPSPEPLPESAFRTETAPPTGGTRYLATGLGAAGVAALLPSLAGASDGGGSLRFGVAAALGTAGVIGFTRAGRPRRIPENVEWNRRQREAWLREVERIRAENEARRAATRLRIVAGRPATVELP